MKKIKNKYHLLVNSLLTTLLGLFAASCERGGVWFVCTVRCLWMTWLYIK